MPGRYGLDDSNGRLVGVAPEAHAASSVVTNATLESKVAAALNLGQAFDHNGTLYVPISDKRIALK